MHKTPVQYGRNAEAPALGATWTLPTPLLHRCPCTGSFVGEMLCECCIYLVCLSMKRRTFGPSSFPFSPARTHYHTHLPALIPVLTCPRLFPPDNLPPRAKTRCLKRPKEETSVGGIKKVKVAHTDPSSWQSACI